MPLLLLLCKQYVTIKYVCIWDLHLYYYCIIIICYREILQCLTRCVLMCVCFLLFQVSCPLWGVLFIKEPGSWVEVRWEYQTAAGWSAYRKGRAVHLIFYTFSSTWRRTVGHFAQTALEYIKKKEKSVVLFVFCFQRRVQMLFQGSLHSAQRHTFTTFGCSFDVLHLCPIDS